MAAAVWTDESDPEILCQKKNPFPGCGSTTTALPSDSNANVSTKYRLTGWKVTLQGQVHSSNNQRGGCIIYKANEKTDVKETDWWWIMTESFFSSSPSLTSTDCLKLSWPRHFPSVIHVSEWQEVKQVSDNERLCLCAESETQGYGECGEFWR